MRHHNFRGFALKTSKSIRPVAVCDDSKAIFFCSIFLSFLVFFVVFSSLQLDIEMFASAQQQPTQRIPPPPTSLLQQNNLSQSLVQVTAGKIQDISFKIDIANDTLGTSGFPQSITNAVVSIASQSGSVKIIGPTTWNLPSIDPNSKHVISTKVYAAPAIIGSPVFFTVTVQYIKNNQELKTNSFDIGAIVTGEIKIDANNLGIRYVGNTPSLVGSLLNKGNTGALFTNIQVLPNSNATIAKNPLGNVKPTSESFQYLGTLPPNTPSPFSIPILLNSKLPDLIQINSTSNSNSSNSILPRLKPTNDSMVGVGTSVNSTYSDVNKNNNGSDFNNATTAANIDLSKSNLLGSQTNYLVPIKVTYTDELTNEHSVILNRSVPLVRSDLQSSDLEGLTGTDNDSSQSAYVVNNGFIDAYWAENVLASDTNTSSSSDSSESTSANSELEVIQNQREVSPGEGPAILAVVLSNIAFSDITGVTGYLTLPNGFSSMIALPINSSASSSSAYAVTNGSNRATLPAISSIKDIVKAGQTYTLYFRVNVLDSASVGPHTALLRTYYFKTSDPEIGAYRVQTTNVPFVLPGKVVMDITSSSNDLTPGEVNNIKIQLRNRGTADANNVLVTLNSASGSIITNQPTVSNDGRSLSGQGQGVNGPNGDLTEIPRQSNSSNTESKLIEPTGGRAAASSLGSRVFSLGTIAANTASEINAAILPSFSAGESLQNLNLELTYTDATGKTRTSEEEIGFRVLPNIPEGGLEINPNRIPQQQQLPPEVMGDSNNNTTSEMNGTLTNLNNESSDNPPPSGLGLRVNPTSLLLQKLNNSNSNDGNNTGLLVNGSAIEAPLQIKSAVLMIKRNDSSPSLYNHQVSLRSNNNNNNATNAITKNNTSVIAAGSSGDTNSLEDITSKSNNIGKSNIEDNSLTITAGEESDVNFTITNNNRFPILDAVVSLESQSGSISISGPSKWNLQRLDPGAHQSFATTVFASTDLIGNPASFEVGAQYIMNGRARDDNFTMGAKVIGDIDVDVSNLAINNIAGTPNLVGNLLNKGNTIALFTTIQLLSPSNNTDNGGPHQPRQEGKTPYQANSSSSQSTSDQNSDQKKSSGNTTQVLIPSSTLPSYLGDLDSNSPLPFSIPLNFQNNSSPGKYPVSLKITYSDDLRANHELVINDTVDFSQRGGRNRGDSNNDEGIMGIMLGDSYSLKFGGVSIPLLIIIIIIAILLIALRIYRRRNGSKSVSTYVTARSKDEKFFLDEKRNKDEMPTSSHINLSEGSREDNNNNNNNKISTPEEKSKEKTDTQRGADLAK
ncbi:MAG TPA: hypothetical protein VH415_09590 [Nitrososphaeraceae archaeon]|jgi:hypothetical protein